MKSSLQVIASTITHSINVSELPTAYCSSETVSVSTACHANKADWVSVPLLTVITPSHTIPRTCCSRAVITLTACCRIISLVSGWPLFVWSEIMWPNSLKASFISRTRNLYQNSHLKSYQYRPTLYCNDQFQFPYHESH